MSLVRSPSVGDRMDTPCIQSPASLLYAGVSEDSEHMDGDPSWPSLLVKFV